MIYMIEILHETTIDVVEGILTADRAFGFQNERKWRCQEWKLLDIVRRGSRTTSRVGQGLPCGGAGSAAACATCH